MVRKDGNNDKDGNFPPYFENGKKVGNFNIFNSNS